MAKRRNSGNRLPGSEDRNLGEPMFQGWQGWSLAFAILTMIYVSIREGCR